MKTRLLLLDGQAPWLRSVGELLATDGWDVKPARDLRQAMAKAAAGETDAVLLAIETHESPAWLRIDDLTEANPFVPVVVVTRPELRSLAEAVGARPWVEERGDVRALSRAMRQWVAAAGMERGGGRAGGGSPARLGPADAEDIRELLQQRASVPFTFAATHRHWGINE